MLKKLLPKNLIIIRPEIIVGNSWIIDFLKLLKFIRFRKEYILGDAYFCLTIPRIWKSKK